MTANLERRDLVDKADAWDAIAAKNTEITRLQEALAAAEAERDEARAANERDRTNIIDAVNSINDAFKRRRWLLGESRGSYEWDDDRFRQEFRDAIAEFEPQIERLRKIGADRADCPKTQAEVNAARSLPALLAETRKKALEEAAAIDVPFPRTLGEAMLESPFKAAERYRAAIRSLLALQENSNG